MKSLKVKNDSGILSMINYIDRDNEISNIKSMEVNTLQIEYRFDSKEKIFEKAKELLEKIYLIILNIEKIINEKYKLPLFLPQKISTKDLGKIVKNPLQLVFKGRVLSNYTRICFNFR